MTLAETIKKTLTKQINIEVHPQDLNKDMIDFVEANLRNFRGGNTSLRFILTEPKSNMRISLVTGTTGFEMNDDFIHFLENKPELGIQVMAS